MYYRVAIRVDGTPTWQWKSTVLSSLNTLFQFLRLFRALPPERLRVFSSTSQEGLAEQLEQENQGLVAHSVTAAQFLRERMLSSPAAMSSTSAREGGTELQRGTVAVISQQASNKRSGGGSVLASRTMSTLERQREELESGPGGDHDVPYSFSLPLSLPQVRAWMTLLAKVQKGELHP
jgi:hypothetical protein